MSGNAMEKDQEDLTQLLKDIIAAVRERNKRPGPGAVPRSDEFFDELTKRHGLVPFTVPTLMRMLVSSSCLFSFTLIEEERKKRVRRIEGYMVTEPGVIDPLIRYYSRELENIYMVEYNRKASCNKIIQELSPKINEYNGTQLGICISTVIMLSTASEMLQWEPLKFSQKTKDSQLKNEVAKGRPLSYFLPGESGETKKIPAHTEAAGKPDSAPSILRYADLRKHAADHTIQKSLEVYGIEFYTRVCFREYQFSLMHRIIQDGIVTRNKDLATIKGLLARERSRADKDPRIQQFASEINALEKLINEKIQGA